MDIFHINLLQNCNIWLKLNRGRGRHIFKVDFALSLIVALKGTLWLLY